MNTERKFHVYGIGNALVDMEFEVTVESLNKAKVEKGLMTLVDETRQGEIISTLHEVHGTEHKRACGGSAANTMIAVAEFGGKSFYSCKVASDETGEFYFKDLKEHGVETNLSSGALEAGTTGKCLVLITPDGDRTMNTFLGITSNFSTKELVEEQLKNSNYLYIEGYLITSPSAKEAMLQAKKIAEENGVKTSISFSDVNMVKYFGDGLREVIGNGVDLLFCNEAEAYAYTNTTDIKEAAEALKKIAKTFAVTLGPQGALIYDGKEQIIVPTAKVDVVDTNGAGDLFAGAMLYGINHGLTFEQAAKLGCSASSTLVTQFGPRLRQEQVTQIKANLKQ